MFHKKENKFVFLFDALQIHLLKKVQLQKGGSHDDEERERDFGAGRCLSIGLGLDLSGKDG